MMFTDGHLIDSFTCPHLFNDIDLCITKNLQCFNINNCLLLK